MSLKERFEQKYIPEPNSGCWLWTACVDIHGYGCISKDNVRNGPNLKAHRVAWELYKGSIPKGLYLCHKCDTPSCVNPEHLFLGTGKDNSADMVKKGRSIRGENHVKSRLTEFEISKIKADKRVHSEIAKEYKVDRRHISYIKAGRYWGWVK